VMKSQVGFIVRILLLSECVDQPNIIWVYYLYRWLKTNQNWSGCFLENWHFDFEAREVYSCFPEDTKKESVAVFKK
jgi:hypothetical protein